MREKKVDFGKIRRPCLATTPSQLLSRVYSLWPTSSFRLQPPSPSFFRPFLTALGGQYLYFPGGKKKSESLKLNLMKDPSAARGELRLELPRDSI